MRPPSPSARVTAIILAIALVAFATLHGYWGFGGTWGLSEALGSETARQPSQTGLWGMTLVLVWCAICALIRAGHGNAQVRRLLLPARITLWLLSLGALAAGIANVFWGTTNFETRVIGPLVLAIAVLAFWTALGGPRAVVPAATDATP